MSDLDIIHIIQEHGGLGSVPLARTVFALRHQIAELERHQAEAAKAIRALQAAGQKLEKSVEELLTEFVSKKRSANWGVINDAGLAFAKAQIEHAAAIKLAREHT